MVNNTNHILAHTTVRIAEYEPAHQLWFENLNRDWIEKFFWMEPIDFEVLQHPEIHIIGPGGKILMAYVDGEVAGTVALKFVRDGVYEFTKMAVAEKFRGQRVGQALAEAAIEKAKSLGAHLIILYSSTKLQPALALYRKIGFKDVPVDGPYKRSDIKMEFPVEKKDKMSKEYSIRIADLQDVKLLQTLGRQTFSDTFGEHNTAENMRVYLDQNFSDATIEAELRDDAAEFLLLYDDQVCAGYARVRRSETPDGLLKPALEIQRIYVAKEYHGKGAGAALMSDCIDRAGQNEFKTIWLGVWEKNVRAIKFYEKYGFTRFGEHVFTLGDDTQTDWLMKKNLTA